MVDDSQITSKGKGIVKLEHGSFKNVLYVPYLASNMLSMYQMTHTGFPKRVTFIPNDVDISEIAFGKLIVTGIINNSAKTYEFSMFVPDENHTTFLNHGNEVIQLWNEIFGHINFKYLQQLQNNSMVEGLPTIKCSKGICKGCIVGKHPEHKFEQGKESRLTCILGLIHFDISIPIPTTSMNGSRYVLTFIDDLPIFTWVYFLKKKSEVLENFIDFKTFVENYTRSKNKDLRSENGGEYIKS